MITTACLLCVARHHAREILAFGIASLGMAQVYKTRNQTLAIG